jgi:bifunctional DNA-binding transcriptional regulator/antitoxin component of YhaV-PrlF toxin-antitoxin module
MNTVSSISRITERGQITLPKKIRDSRFFAHSRAVSISLHNGVVTLTPIKSADSENEHLTVLDTTLAGWSDLAHDDLFDFTA